jgi:hypothetical protein
VKTPPELARDKTEGKEITKKATSSRGAPKDKLQVFERLHQVKKKVEVINEEPAPTSVVARKRSLEVIERLNQPKRQANARLEEPLAQPAGQMGERKKSSALLRTNTLSKVYKISKGDPGRFGALSPVKQKSDSESHNFNQSGQFSKDQSFNKEVYFDFTTGAQSIKPKELDFKELL